MVVRHCPTSVGQLVPNWIVSSTTILSIWVSFWPRLASSCQTRPRLRQVSLLSGSVSLSPAPSQTLVVACLLFRATRRGSADTGFGRSKGGPRSSAAARLRQKVSLAEGQKVSRAVRVVRAKCAARPRRNKVPPSYGKFEVPPCHISRMSSLGKWAWWSYVVDFVEEGTGKLARPSP